MAKNNDVYSELRAIRKQLEMLNSRTSKSEKQLEQVSIKLASTITRVHRNEKDISDINGKLNDIQKVLTNLHGNVQRLLVVTGISGGAGFFILIAAAALVFLIQ